MYNNKKIYHANKQYNINYQIKILSYTCIQLVTIYDKPFSLLNEEFFFLNILFILLTLLFKI